MCNLGSCCWPRMSKASILQGRLADWLIKVAGAHDAGITPRDKGDKADPWGGDAQRRHPTRNKAPSDERSSSSLHSLSCVGSSSQLSEAGRKRSHYPHFTEGRLRLTKASGDLPKFAGLGHQSMVFQLQIQDTFLQPSSLLTCLGLMKVTWWPN